MHKVLRQWSGKSKTLMSWHMSIGYIWWHLHLSVGVSGLGLFLLGCITWSWDWLCCESPVMFQPDELLIYNIIVMCDLISHWCPFRQGAHCVSSFIRVGFLKQLMQHLTPSKPLVLLWVFDKFLWQTHTTRRIIS